MNTVFFVTPGIPPISEHVLVPVDPNEDMILDRKIFATLATLVMKRSVLWFLRFASHISHVTNPVTTFNASMTFNIITINATVAIAKVNTMEASEARMEAGE